MKIELSGSDKKLTFGDVKVGEVFISGAGLVAIKIEPVNTENGYIANAVYLEDGDHNKFNDGDFVRRIIKNAVLREEE